MGGAGEAAEGMISSLLLIKSSAPTPEEKKKWRKNSELSLHSKEERENKTTKKKTLSLFSSLSFSKSREPEHVRVARRHVPHPPVRIARRRAS